MAGMLSDSLYAPVPSPRKIMQAMAHPFALVAAQAVGRWPIWEWYVRRVSDGSDEPWGLLALGGVLLVLRAQRGNLRQEPQPSALLGAGLLTVLCAVSSLWLPPLPRAVLGVSALGLTLAAILDRRRPLLPLWVMLLLSLPVVSSLQFYLGYPLRAFTAWGSGGLLAMVGLGVVQTGTALTWLGRTVLVDAPCSGIRMLWVGMFLTTLLSYLTRASLNRFALNAAVALLVILAANVLRNTVLFVKEADIIHLPAWTHAGTGLLAFLLTSLLIAGVTRWRAYAR